MVLSLSPQSLPSTSDTIRGYIGGNLNDLKGNANRVRSYPDLRVRLANDAISTYVMEEYPEDITRLHRDGFIYIHDRSEGIIPYCHGGDLNQLLGLGLWTPQIVGGPAKHFSSALNQVTNYLCTMQKYFAGAQAFADFNTLLAPLVWKDKLTDEQIEQGIQETWFDLNFPSRGPETPFTNVMFNGSTPDIWADEHCVSPGLTEHKYGDFQDESNRILAAANRVYHHGDVNGTPFTFPIPTINLTPKDNMDDPMWDDVFKTTAKYGTYYFMNYRGSGIKAGSKRAMCCRFNIDYDELSAAGGRWALEGSTGSLGIVTINLAKVGYMCRDSPAQIYDMLDFLMEKSLTSLLIKEKWIESMFRNGLMPVPEHYGITMKRFFHTLGILGFDEMFMNMYGSHIYDNIPEAQRVLTHMREWTRAKQKDSGILINIEQTPGEEAASKMASADLKQSPATYHQGPANAPYYSTVMVPASISMGITTRARIEEQLLPLMTGGTVHRIYMGESDPDYRGVKKIALRVADATRIPYFDFTATFSKCPDCYTNASGVVVECPSCGHPMRVYSRITGYYRDMMSANPGKVAEFLDRKYVGIGESLNAEPIHA